MILEYEKLQRQLIRSGYGPSEYCYRDSKSKLSMAMREFHFIQTKGLWDVTKPPTSSETSQALNYLFNVQHRSLSTLNPANCFWLRFPTFSPLLPWRQIQTEGFATAYQKVCHLINLSYPISCTSLGAAAHFQHGTQ
jgi:hypothetical protein